MPVVFFTLPEIWTSSSKKSKFNQVGRKGKLYFVNLFE